MTTYQITLTPEAVKQAIQMQKSNEDYQNKFVRVYIDGKGCDGFYYGVAFDDLGVTDIKFPQSEDLTVIVDEDSLIFLNESTIEWVDDERGRGFLVNNPRQKKFRGKFFKKQAWQTALSEKKREDQ